MTDFSFHLLMFLLSAFSSSFIVLSVRMTCYASLLNPKLKVLHAYTHSVRREMDGCWAGATADPFFFFLLEVDRVDTLRRQHKRVWQVVRHNEITFPSVSYKTTTPFFFFFFTIFPPTIPHPCTFEITLLLYGCLPFQSSQ